MVASTKAPRQNLRFIGVPQFQFDYGKDDRSPQEDYRVCGSDSRKTWTHRYRRTRYRRARTMLPEMRFGGWISLWLSGWVPLWAEFTASGQGISPRSGPRVRPRWGG